MYIHICIYIYVFPNYRPPLSSFDSAIDDLPNYTPPFRDISQPCLERVSSWTLGNGFGGSLMT